MPLNKNKRYVVHTHAHSHHIHPQSYEDAMKSEQAEKHCLEKQLLTLQQKLQEESSTDKEYQAMKKQ